MKKGKLSKAALFATLLSVALLSTGCSSSGNSSSSSNTSSLALQTLDFSTVMTSFSKDQNKTNDWDRTNIITADTTTTATIAAPHGETKPVIMLKGDSGTLVATSATSGTLTTDPTKNSYFASALLLKDGTPAQYGDGIYKFKQKLSAPQDGQWNTAIIFKDSTPQKTLDDKSVNKALAIVTIGGDVQIQKNYKKGSTVVTQEVVKDTGVKINDGKYHYFILAMQDVSSGTNIKLWIDGNVAYKGVVKDVTGKGAIQIVSNSTPMFDSNKKPLITNGTTAGTFATVTACGESYFGGYDDGPTVSDITLDPIK
jgi:hypothetical protein